MKFYHRSYVHLSILITSPHHPTAAVGFTIRKYQLNCLPINQLPTIHTWWPVSLWCDKQDVTLMIRLARIKQKWKQFVYHLLQLRRWFKYVTFFKDLSLINLFYYLTIYLPPLLPEAATTDFLLNNWLKSSGSSSSNTDALFACLPVIVSGFDLRFILLDEPKISASSSSSSKIFSFLSVCRFWSGTSSFSFRSDAISVGFDILSVTAVFFSIMEDCRWCSAAIDLTVPILELENNKSSSSSSPKNDLLRTRAGLNKLSTFWESTDFAEVSVLALADSV